MCITIGATHSMQPDWEYTLLAGIAGHLCINATGSDKYSEVVTLALVLVNKVDLEMFQQF